MPVLHLQLVCIEVCYSGSLYNIFLFSKIANKDNNLNCIVFLLMYPFLSPITIIIYYKHLY